MMLVSYPLAFLVIRTIKETNYDTEKVIYARDVKKDELERGEHHAAEGTEEKNSIEKEKDEEPVA